MRCGSKTRKIVIFVVLLLFIFEITAITNILAETNDESSDSSTTQNLPLSPLKYRSVKTISSSVGSNSTSLPKFLAAVSISSVSSETDTTTCEQSAPSKATAISSRSHKSNSKSSETTDITIIPKTTDTGLTVSVTSDSGKPITNVKIVAAGQESKTNNKGEANVKIPTNILVSLGKILVGVNMENQGTSYRYVSLDEDNGNIANKIERAISLLNAPTPFN